MQDTPLEAHKLPNQGEGVKFVEGIVAQNVLHSPLEISSGHSGLPGSLPCELATRHRGAEKGGGLLPCMQCMNSQSIIHRIPWFNLLV